MEFLKFLEGLRNPVCDFLFSTITHLGEELFFLVLAILVFWCIDKKGGYFVLISGFIGTILNQSLKLTFRVDRPFVADPNFTIVEAAREEATGFSFPSGHTQNIGTTLGSIGLFFKNNWVRAICAALIILVSFSRMYLGVHYPSDVIVSIFIAATLVVVLYPFFFDDLRFKRRMPWIIGICLLLAVGYVVYACVIPTDLFVGEAALKNLASGIENSAKLLGCIIGLCIIYPLDYFVIKFDTKAPWYGQIMKLVLGLGVLLLLKEGLKTPLMLFFGLFTDSPDFMAKLVRYLIVVVFAGAVWPLTFKFFAGIKIPALDRFGEWVKGLFAKKKVADKENSEKA